MGRVGESEEVVNMVKTALQLGFRHLDTASNYGNEHSVGLGIQASGIPREEIYVTTKLSGEDHGRVAEALDTSLAKLQLEYVDMYLMHWPQALTTEGTALKPDESPTILETWRQMEELVVSGKAKGIGVSNYSIKTLTPLLEHARIVPAINQVEMHPCLPQHALLAFCQERGIHLTAYSPIGKNKFSTDADLLEVARTCTHDHVPGVTATQVLLSWAVQRGTSVIPKSFREDRLRENLRLVQLGPEAMKVLDNLHKKEGMHRSVCGFHSSDLGGSCFGWTYEQLGWNMTLGGIMKD
ncbi:hypothetical protein D9758_011091 [Tetrapyrgos nigripes]|uniref:NADP-dependent oxidoreductase domain-containing protein n=1 Tax=Tetrapyrgos nigripes TaxID=182062 RepID=A0A8H5FSJ6_9AGAR|nr:hypothetical protein D9758_011091 [Tetrapyrgos nigripes]